MLGSVLDSKMASDSESGSEYEVDKLLQQRKRRGLIEYLVRWKGFGPENDSWEEAKTVNHLKNKIEEFNSQNESPKKSRARSRSRSKTRSTPKRSRSRGRRSTSRGRRSTSGGRKSPGRKAATQTKSTTVVRRSTRVVSGGEVQKSTEVTTASKTETIPENSRATNVVVTQTKETIRTTSSNTSSANARSADTRSYKLPEWMRLTTSDYPLMIIFICVTLITLSFVLEKYINFGDCWASVQQTGAAVWSSIGKLFSRKVK